MTHPQGRQWHVPDSALLAYAREQSSDAEAWSIETHLPECARCREQLSASVFDTELADELALTKLALRSFVAPALHVSSVAGAPSRAVPSRASWWPFSSVSRTLMGRAPWLVAVFALTLLAILTDLGWSQWAPDSTRGLDSLMLLFGPVLPLVGVAFVCSASTDPCAEIVLSTPSAGLRMVLWRTVSVLLVATPLTTALGVATGAASAGALLVPTLAITMATLAVGSRTGLDTAAAVIGGAWILVVILPSVAASRMVLPVYAESAMWWWIAALTLGAVATLWQRDRFERIPSFAIPGSEGHR